MKHLKNILTVLLLAAVSFFASNAYAASFPKQTNAYVNDYSNILSSSELDQLRTDVKAMCDYYSTKIVVCLVSSFGDYTAEGYAAELGSRWGILDNNGLLILVKPKSIGEQGEALITTSSDLKSDISSSTCQNIVSKHMVPHFKNNDYYGGIEAALKYLNDMSGTDNESSETAVVADSDSQDSNGSTGFLSNGMKSILMVGVILLGLFILVPALTKFLNKFKNLQNASQPKGTTTNSPSETNRQQKDNDTNRSDSNKKGSDPLEKQKKELEQMKKELEELKRMGEKSEQTGGDQDDIQDIIRANAQKSTNSSTYREQEAAPRRENRDGDQHFPPRRDNSDNDQNFPPRRGNPSDSETGSASGENLGYAENSALGKVGKAVIIAGGAIAAGKVLKSIKEKRDGDNTDDSEGGLLDKVEDIIKGKKDDSTSDKPKLGSDDAVSNGEKPKLGGSSKAGKPKLGGQPDLDGSTGKDSW